MKQVMSQSPPHPLVPLVHPLMAFKAGLSGFINHLGKKLQLCVKERLKGKTRREHKIDRDTERERGLRWVSWTGGQGQSLSHLGSSSPSALDRLTCIHPPAQEGPQAHIYRVGVSPTHSHARSQTQVSSVSSFGLLALPRGTVKLC